MKSLVTVKMIQAEKSQGTLAGNRSRYHDSADHIPFFFQPT